jgi:hypothetical protein
VALFVAGSACRRESASGAPGPEQPPATRAPGALPLARVTIESPSGRASTVRAEVARTDADRDRGLMFRERLGDDEGMLFVFDEEADHRFWMKNTLVPLDMIFIDGAGRVVGVVARAAPGTLEPRSAGRSRSVLEVRGGWAAERSVARGDRVTVEELPR